MKSKELIEFDELKFEYSLPETSKTRKIELIKMMQDNLKKRCAKNIETIMCLDGNEYSLESENVSELYAIDSTLKNAQNRKWNNEISDSTRETMLSRNKYTPGNLYSKK